jgi:hypothetical protein
MTGDLGGFDCAATDLLAPRYVGSAEGVRPKLGEAAAFGFSSRGGASQVRYDLRRARMGRTGQRLRSVSETFALKGSRFVIAPEPVTAGSRPWLRHKAHRGVAGIP